MSRHGAWTVLLLNRSLSTSVAKRRSFESLRVDESLAASEIRIWSAAATAAALVCHSARTRSIKRSPAPHGGRISTAMETAKEQVQEILETLSEDASLEDIQYHIYVRQKIQQGLDDVEAGRVISHDKVQQCLRIDETLRKRGGESTTSR